MRWTLGATGGRRVELVEEPRQRAAGMQNIACKDPVSHIGLTADNTFVTVERTLHASEFKCCSRSVAVSNLNPKLAAVVP